MTAYAVTARVQPASPHLRDHVSAPWSMTEVETDARIVDLDAPAADRHPLQRLDEVRVTWLESTFYLFDPESWR